MNGKHYLTKLVKTYHKSKKEPPVAAAKGELQKAFSKEQLTETLRKRLSARRKHEELLQQVLRLEQELLDTRGTHGEHVEHLLAKIQRMKKKIEEKT